MRFRQGTTLTRKDPLKSCSQRIAKSPCKMVTIIATILEPLGCRSLYHTTSLCWWLNCFICPHTIRFFYVTIKITKKVNGYDGSNANNPNIPSLRRYLILYDLHVPKLHDWHMSGSSLSVLLSPFRGCEDLHVRSRCPSWPNRPPLNPSTFSGLLFSYDFSFRESCRKRRDHPNTVLGRNDCHVLW